MEDKNDLKFLQGFTKVRNYIEQELAKVRISETVDVVGEIECQEKSSTIQ